MSRDCLYADLLRSLKKDKHDWSTAKAAPSSPVEQQEEKAEAEPHKD
eukprot:CAMPEP_0167807234 /NCGR_PEP_ID=MMETSP0111_2-20121227/22385_1 /TAXON_ID=91324 /ORGANISM="Lotharella globosa, Strain CCCM811" /LENGTH=46 /DNA_ID= /DNA_START= /DNA_END= /DNA_ORIENTATION=